MARFRPQRHRGKNIYIVSRQCIIDGLLLVFQQLTTALDEMPFSLPTGEIYAKICDWGKFYVLYLHKTQQIHQN
jgi:hypothetical protein